MNEREAIEIIEGGSHDWQSIYDALAVAVNALKKRIPKEAILNETEGFMKCPSCGLVVDPGDTENYRFCMKCGQRLEVRRNAEQEN